MSLHWRIAIGLILGVVVGLAIDALWVPATTVTAADGTVMVQGTWASMGVNDAASFMTRKHTDANAAAGFAAYAARFLINLNQFIGAFFLQCLKFVAIPVVLFSIIAGAASVGDVRKLGRIGVKTLLIFALTVLIAVFVALLLVNLLVPGSYVDEAARQNLAAANLGRVNELSASTGKVTTVWQFLIDIVPTNAFAALASGAMLQVVVLGIVIGIGLTVMPEEKSRPIISACETLAEIFIQTVMFVMKASPIAVFALIVPQVAAAGASLVGALAVYAITVILGLAVVLFIEYPAILWLLGGVTPARFFKAMAPAQLLAFSSSSSAATLPVTLECTIHRLKVSPRVASFVCPLGATLNMDGTALYQAIAASFIAQVFGIEMSLTDQISLVLLTALASVGAPGIPSGGTVILLAVLQSVGLPPAGLAIILALDRPLDMLRTVINVSGDAVASAIVNRTEGDPPVEPAFTDEASA